MEDQLQVVEAKLIKSASHFPVVRDFLLRKGGFRAWFLYYEGVNQWTKRFYDQQLFFLLDKELLSIGIYPDGKMALTSYKLDDFSLIQRDYEYADKDTQEMILSGVTITLKRSGLKNRPELLVFKRPLESEKGDPVGFDSFMELLD